jgi:large subunit ribosomal protein L25
VIPAVLYGHGEQTVNLAVPAEQVHGALRHGSRVVDLRGDVKQSALIREVQWDAFGVEVLHLDLTRVSATERVEVPVAVELRGEAPGAKLGGIVDQPQHEVEIECPAANITDKVVLSINNLQLGDSLTADDLELPEGATLITPGPTVLVQCVEAQVPEEEEVAVETAEPEVIGKKEEDEEGEKGEG